MNTYLALFLISLSVSISLTPLLRRVCERFGWLDLPKDGRRVHRKPVPRLGGVAIFISVVVALTSLLFIDNLATQVLKSNLPALFTVFVPATLVFLFGIYDDLYGSKAALKFTVLGIAATIFYALGGRIDALSIPFWGIVELPPVLGFALTLIWMIGIANAFNLIDGMDRARRPGAALFASLVLLLVSLHSNRPLLIIVSLVLTGSLIGFLRYNFNPASIFMGDSGALFIGFLLAAISIQGTQKASTAVAVAIPLMAFGLPIVDTALTIARRFISGRPLFQGDSEHIHHMLLARGWSQRRVVFVLYGVCALFGLMALLFVRDTGSSITGLMLVAVGASVVLAAGRLRYHEVEEVKASVRRNLGERRKRAANHIRIRQASRAMSKAKNINELIQALKELLESGEFAYANIEIGYANRIVRTSSWPGGNSLKHGIELRDGNIRWSWQKNGDGAPDVSSAENYWSLRLPLSHKGVRLGYLNLYRRFDAKVLLLDINYLCHLFQQELAEAAQRVLDIEEEAESPKAMKFAVGSADS